MIVLVTGTSSGIGQAVAAQLGAAGHTVFAGSLEGPTADPPAGVTELPLDVRSEDSVRSFVGASLARGGRIDALVNNAAYGLSGSLEEITIEEARKVLETNLFGIVRTTRAVLPHFRAQRGGRLVNISSGAGFTAEPFAGWYTVSKFAVEGFSETLWHELRPFGVRVSLVQPGWCRTNIVRDAVFTRSRSPSTTPGARYVSTRSPVRSRLACRPTESRGVSARAPGASAAAALSRGSGCDVVVLGRRSCRPRLPPAGAPLLPAASATVAITVAARVPCAIRCRWFRFWNAGP